ncbi:HD domain-containing phosphohydrolase [Terasakiella sp. SH-1]|uniref:HD-GYP domain-containing protein n=1 Tax=Terasakiella sp. SH-1 TaxID=2560057 RepID=UPI0010747949|nr:HD domain-containing phosphohydrolase [Terasakiella sp. SH-1]
MLQKVLSHSELSIAQRLCEIHEEIRTLHPELCRIAIAIYDRETDKLKTFAHSTEGDSPISFYEAQLSEAKSLQDIAQSHDARVIDDLRELPTNNRHTDKLLESGYLSSMTIPINFKGALYGFLFFNATEPSYFNEARRSGIKAYAGVISLLVVNELQTLKTFRGAVKTAREFSRQRDEETGNHLERMSRFSRLIARDLAPKHGKEEDWVEYIFQFAPLHDVGKVAIPDNILLKPGRLDTDELDVMRTHVQKGSDIITVMSQEFDLDALNHFDILRNIIAGHHEKMDGSGYPLGLKGEEIPLEARICAVADIFDALTSCRPYKKPWTNEEAMGLLRDQAGKELDQECVDSFISQIDEVERIQKEFVEDFAG